MKKNHLYPYYCLILCICFMLSPLSACSPQETASRTVKIDALWIQYTFEEAVEEASTIVRGTVTAKSDTQIHESTASNGHVHREYYRNVTIDVTDILKGQSDLETVTYSELCGIHEGVEYRYSGFELLEIGDEVMLFLNDRNTFIAPSGLRIADEDGNISVSSDMLPVSAGQTRPSPPSYTTMPIEDYCGIIRDYLAQ